MVASSSDYFYKPARPKKKKKYFVFYHMLEEIGVSSWAFLYKKICPL